jgi:hypothetical protein
MLGGMDDRSQRAQIKNDEILSNLSRLLPVQTPGGVQDMVCLERMGLARWINSLTLSTIRADLRPRIAQFQWDVAMAADRLLFGEEISPEPTRFAIIPDASSPIADTVATRRLSDSDVRRLILALVERKGENRNRSSRAAHGASSFSQWYHRRGCKAMSAMWIPVCRIISLYRRPSGSFRFMASL